MYDNNPVLAHSNDPAMPSLQCTPLPDTAGNRSGVGGSMRLFKLQSPPAFVMNATVPPPPPSPGIPMTAFAPFTANDADHNAPVSTVSTPSFDIADHAPSRSVFAR